MSILDGGPFWSLHLLRRPTSPFRPRLTWSLFCNLFIFPASFFCCRYCLSFSCTLMAPSGTCRSFSAENLLAILPSSLFQCVFWKPHSARRSFSGEKLSGCLYVTVFLGDFCPSLVVHFCHYFLLFKFE